MRAKNGVIEGFRIAGTVMYYRLKYWWADTKPQILGVIKQLWPVD